MSYYLITFKKLEKITLQHRTLEIIKMSFVCTFKLFYKTIQVILFSSSVDEAW